MRFYGGLLIGNCDGIHLGSKGAADAHAILPALHFQFGNTGFRN